MIDMPRGQSPALQSPVVQSLLLRNALIRLRKSRELTQERVAKDLEWSTAKIIRLEGGRTSISRTDLQVLLIEYGVTAPEEAERLQELARGARQPAWWQDYQSDFSKAFHAYIGYEAGAHTLHQAHHAVIPGLLQTPSYAKEYARGMGVDAASIDRRVDFRLKRQQQIKERQPPLRQCYVLDEAVIRRRVGSHNDSALMVEQLRHLVAVSQRDEVNIHIIPYTQGAHPGLEIPFTLLEFDGDLDDILYLEAGRWYTEIVTGDDERITDHRARFEELKQRSLSKPDSLQLIEQAIEPTA